MKTSAWIALPLLILLALNGCERAPVAPQGDPLPADQAPPEPLVTVIFNGVIHTVDERVPLAAAMAFDGDGEILAVGEPDRVLSDYPGAILIDLEGMTVVPGLIDSHAHLDGLALSMTRANLTGTGSVQEVLQVLREHEAGLAPGDWLMGRGWDQNDWPVQDFPSRADLDRDFPDRPVVLGRVDGHATWVNSAALALVDRDLGGDWQPQGGFIHRDAQGQATGILVDGAKSLVNRLVPKESEGLLENALDLALQQMVSLGLTGVHQAGGSMRFLRRIQRHIEADRFPSRIYFMTEGVGEVFDRVCGEGGISDASGRLYAHSTKLYADGALGSRGAALLTDYSDDPGNVGLLFLSPDDLQSQVSRAMSCGFQVAVHAIGDRGNQVVLDALEAGQQRFPDNPGRHRVEHAQVLDADDVARFAALGVIAAVQPTHATSDMYWAGERLGEERLRYAYAWRSLLDSGARLALGSDFPVEQVNPMHGFYAAVARRDLKGWPDGGWYPAEALSRAEALRGFTLDAAYAGFMEEQVGSLEPGKRADFVILDRDIMAVPAEEIPSAVVLETWLDGQRVFRLAPE